MSRPKEVPRSGKVKRVIKMRLLVAGSRTFNDYDFMFTKLLKILSQTDWNGLEILSGGAKGADELGRTFAEVFNIPFKLFPAKWDEHGKSAGFIRNKAMVNYCTHCVVFWDGKSKGTKHTIDLCKQGGIPIRIVLFES